MNLNAITKHYSKLTTRERFILLNAANKRGDNADCAAIIQSSPAKNWRIPTLRGLTEAFTRLASWHVMTMLELSEMYFLLLVIGDDDTSGDILTMLRMRGLSRYKAWQTVCNEYGIDPDDLIADYPGTELIRFFVDAMTKYSEMFPIDVDSTEYINEMQAVIEDSCKHWK